MPDWHRPATHNAAQARAEVVATFAADRIPVAWLAADEVAVAQVAVAQVAVA